MAITNTRTVERITVYPAQGVGDYPAVTVDYQHTFDDSTDDQLPATTLVTKHLDRYTITVAEDGTETSTATDVTGEDQMVQDICAAIWTE